MNAMLIRSQSVLFLASMALGTWGLLGTVYLVPALVSSARRR